MTHDDQRAAIVCLLTVVSFAIKIIMANFAVPTMLIDIIIIITTMLRQLILAALIFLSISSWGDNRSFNEIRQTLEDNSGKAVQEKAYLHLDNTCYFIGDTIWYKAYVVKADSLRQTDMSRILYVELLNPDGLVVERQRIIISDKGFCNGCFALQDSLYSGYYELRAYTRWMLNWGVSHHRYGREDRYSFYSNSMAHDFFRQWDGLYSRVIPIYEKPDQAGDFTYKQMLQRPKQRAQKATKESLNATFFPEGGQLVKGVTCRVAFELTDQDGRAVDVAGTVTAGGKKVADIKPSFQGRGTITVTPGDNRLKASFHWNDWDYSFDLPKANDSGATLTLAGKQATITTAGLPTGSTYGVSILCRGVLQHFQTITPGADGKATLSLPSLPTGVNDITVFDTEGKILADRLFFVNNHDYDGGIVTVESGEKKTYEPYEKVSLTLKCDGVDKPTTLSVAVRDTQTDENTYNDGNIMTDMLLGSELKGFIANPAYYFEADDNEHRERLDLLMMVQGWRKYKWEEHADTAYATRRYQPETTMTVEGAVYKMLSINEVEPEEIQSWRNGVGYVGQKDKSQDEDNDMGETTDDSEADVDENGLISSDRIELDSNDDNNSDIEYGRLLDANDNIGVNHGGLKHEVIVEAEVTLGTQTVGATQETHDGGRYLFQIPPFYGDATLTMKAYDMNDSIKRNMASRKDKYAFDEDAFPDYYVKRDLFYPRFTTPYSYYQNHEPEISTSLDLESLSSLTMENEEHLLRNVNVKGKRHGKRSIDYKKPAYVADAYELYNELTDYGLSYGKFDMRLFPTRVCQLLYGNMGRYISFNVDGYFNGRVFYRNYEPDSSVTTIWDNYNPRALYNTFKLKRLDKLRFFSDYEPRRENAPMEESRLSADVTVEIVPIADDGVQPSSRDRRIVLHGFNAPKAFYNPDYSTHKPDTPDYRRTLYWNPNAHTDAEGRLQIDFFTGSKQTRIKLSAAGLTADGHFIRSK